MLGIFKRQKRTPEDLADQAQRILSGQYPKWDVDDYENASLQDPRLKDLHIKTLKFGLPEEWVKLDEARAGRILAGRIGATLASRLSARLRTSRRALLGRTAEGGCPHISSLYL